jgi:hypothetical protein
MSAPDRGGVKPAANLGGALCSGATAALARRAAGGAEEANYRGNPPVGSGGDGTIRRFDMRLNYFSRRFLATAAAAGDWQAHLDFQQGCRPLIDNLADLAIADGMTHANVHGGSALDPAARGSSRADGLSCKYKCE